MKTRSSIGMLFIGAITLTIISCSNRPYFVIENETNKIIEVEIIRDSINLFEIVAKDIIDKRPYTGKYYSKWDDPLIIDSVKETILTSKGKEYFIKYLYDSLTVRSLLYNIWRSPHVINEFTIERIDKQDASTDEVDYNQNVFEYYHRDSTCIKKILKENKVTFFLPPNYLLIRECLACGDCSCSADEAFPFVKELRVAGKKSGEYIVFTKSNIQKLMSKKRFHSQSNSLVYEIE